MDFRESTLALGETRARHYIPSKGLPTLPLVSSN